MSFHESSSEDYSDSDTEYEFELCYADGSCEWGSSEFARLAFARLPFDPASIENVILSITDQFNLRVLLNETNVKKAMLITAGLTLAGSLIGKHYGGKAGAMVGGAVGGACSVGVIVVSMRDIWQDVKGKLCELIYIVYDYLAGLGIEDYKMAANFLLQNREHSSQLAMIILQVTTHALRKKIVSCLVDI